MHGKHCARSFLNYACKIIQTLHQVRQNSAHRNKRGWMSNITYLFTQSYLLIHRLCTVSESPHIIFNYLYEIRCKQVTFSNLLRCSMAWLSTSEVMASWKSSTPEHNEFSPMWTNPGNDMSSTAISVTGLVYDAFLNRETKTYVLMDGSLDIIRL